MGTVIRLVVDGAGDGAFQELEAEASADATVSDLVDAVTGAASPPGRGLRMGGRTLQPDLPLAAAGLVHGSLVTIGATASADGDNDGFVRDLAAAPPARVACELRVVAGLGAGRRVGLAPGPHAIGRSALAGVTLGAASLSRRHAVLHVDADGVCRIEDEGSTNGSWIGSVAVRGPVPLAPQQVVRMGAVGVATVPLAAAGAPPPSAPEVAAAVAPPPSAPAPGVGLGRDVDAAPVGWSPTRPLHRSPRPVVPPPPASVPLPPSRPEPPAPMRFGWAALLAPLVLGLAMAVLFSPIMAAFALFGPVMLVGSWLEDRRRVRGERRRAERSLDRGLDALRCDVDAAVDGELARRRTLAPDIAAVLAQADGTAPRLWERRPGQDDAGRVVLGIGTLRWPPGTSMAPAGAAAPEAEALVAATVLVDAPVELDLSPGAVCGLVGDREAVLAVARSLVLQACTHTGPSDLRVGVLASDATSWDWAKWLPHALGRITSGADGAAALVEALTAPSLDTRATALVVVDEPALFTGRAAPGRALLAGGALAVVVLAPDRHQLPAACTTVVELDADAVATLEGQSAGADILAAGLDEADARAAARRLAAFDDPETDDGAALPRAVPLLSLLGIDEPSGPAIAARWAHANIDGGLRAPIGRSERGSVSIDVVGDGPHGLIAGTTGSGKSELLRTIVASLAATAPPEMLSFVLLDYKGGSAFADLAGLPHVVGVVTDLDAHLGARALRCLEAELRHRERRLRAAGAPDIDAHRRRTRPEDEPLPRLLVVVDELATLVSELPDFVDALVGIAQRGRSLGVHLLLATQRPAGALNDNIRANTNLRIALRVQDVADSIDIIASPVAAALDRHVPGRALLRSGHGEVLSFQAATVSSSSPPPARARVVVRPFVVDRPPEPPDDAARTDLRRLVAATADAATALGTAPARCPWPASLADRVPLASLPPGAAALVDEPDQQRQRPWRWEPGTGNLLVFGVQGSGTTSALIALAVSEARVAGPEQLFVYALDLGHGGLAPLRALPHVGAVVGAAEPERRDRLVRTLRDELERRRTIAARGAGGLEQLASVLLLVDGFEALLAALDDASGAARRDDLVRLLADGAPLGIRCAIAADRPGAIPSSFASLVAERLVFRLADPYDWSAFGIAARQIPRLPPGRCIEVVSGRELQMGWVDDPASLVPAALVPSALVGADRRCAPPIATLPATVEASTIGDASHRLGTWWLPIGIGDHALAPVGLQLGAGDHVLVAGPARSGRSTTLCVLAGLLADAGAAVTAVALRPSPLRALARREVGVVTELDDLSRALSVIEADDRPQIVLVDDCDDIDDATGALRTLSAHRRPGLHVIAAGRNDVLRASYGTWVHEVRRSRLGVALRPQFELDGELWQTTFPRSRGRDFPPGRGLLVADGSVELVQVACPAQDPRGA